MPVIDINLGHRNYKLSCGVGEEERVRGLASEVNNYVHQVQKSVSEHTSDAVVLAMVTLMLQDEIEDLRKKLSSNSGQATSESSGESVVEKTDQAVAEAIDAISDYVESIASRIETQ